MYLGLPDWSDMTGTTTTPVSTGPTTLQQIVGGFNALFGAGGAFSNQPAVYGTVPRYPTPTATTSSLLMPVLIIGAVIIAAKLSRRSR